MKRLSRSINYLAIGTIALLLFMVLLARFVSKNPEDATYASAPYAFLFDAKHAGNYEVYRFDVDQKSTQLTSDPQYDSWWPKMSPDQQRILFYRSPAGSHDKDYAKTSLWLMNADGSNQRQIIPTGAYGWTKHGHGEWSPDGNRIVMFAGVQGTGLVTTDPDGKNPQLLSTPGHTAVVDPSWLLDGSGIVYVNENRVYKVSADTSGPPVQLTDGVIPDFDPYMSPNGQQLAVLSQTSRFPPIFGKWAIRLMKSDGSQAHMVIDDGNINSKPAWLPDGSGFYFHRFIYGEQGGASSIWYIKADGTGLAKIRTQKAWSEYPESLYKHR